MAILVAIFGVLITLGLSTDVLMIVQGAMAVALLVLLVACLKVVGARDKIRLGELLMGSVEQLQQGILLVDTKGVIRHSSRGAARLFGYQSLELRPLELVLPEFDAIAFWSELDGKRSMVHQVTFKTRSGEELSGLLEMGVLESDGENLLFVLARDVTARQHEEGQLKSALDEAKEANRAKSAFLANMSHEIRTPLTAILGYADILLRPGVLDAAQGNLAAQVRLNAEHLLSVVNDILDLSRVEAGAVELQEEPCNLLGLISSICSPMLPMAKSQGLRFSASIGSELPEEVKVDAHRLRQVLINLVSNAIKFTPEGYVEFYVTAEPGTDSRVRIRFSIIDSGVGIDEDGVAKLFNPFSRVKGAGMREIEGSGLGLSIAKRLAERMGGGIEVSTEVGIGSVFTMVIDVEQVGTSQVPSDAVVPMVVDPDVPEQELPSLDGVLALVVDDNPHNQEIQRFFLEEAGATVEVVESGQKAVQRIVSGVAPDVVLLDMQMPDMDGFAVAGKLRELGVGTPLVAVTAYAMVGDREKCLAAGCDAYLSKPVRRSELVNMVARHANAVHTIDAPPTTPSTDKFTTLRRDYISRLPDTIERLNDAFRHGQIEQLELLAHRLKGSAGSYGFDSLSHAAAAFEQFLGRDVSASDQELALKSLIHEMRMAVREGV